MPSIVGPQAAESLKNETLPAVGKDEGGAMSQLLDADGSPILRKTRAASVLDVAALDPVELGQQISQLSSSQWRWGVVEEVRIELLRRHLPSHCTFEFLVRTESGWHVLIGKAYAEEAEGRDVHQATEVLWQAGFDRKAEVSVPRPIAYVPSLRLLLQEKVKGLVARDIFKYGDERLRAAAAERCAQWLARFHARAPHSGPVTSVETMLARSEGCWRLISREGGALAAQAGRLLERLRAAASSLGSVALCRGHGDFRCEHVIFAGRRTVTFDWDLHDLADPARDVARFIFMLQRQALHRLGDIRALDRSSEAFREAYLAAGGLPVAAHLPFYKAALCLRGAKKDVRTGRLKCRTWAEAMLDEGLRILEQ